MDLTPAELAEAMRAALPALSAPDRIRAALDMLVLAPADRQPALVAALYVHLGLPRTAANEQDVRAQCAYPAAPIDVCAGLVLGQPPVSYGQGLTRAEAHRWLTEAPDLDPAAWLVRAHAVDATTRSVSVARWLITRMQQTAQRAALERSRTERGPHGETIRGSYLQRADELRPNDLRPGVEDTFARCAKRLLSQVTRSMQRQFAPLATAPAWWTPVRCARLLLTPAALVAEGRQLDHCIATYAPYVRDGESVVVALDVLGARSTTEIERSTAKVRQHKGSGNSVPADLSVRALAVLSARWQRAIREGR